MEGTYTSGIVIHSLILARVEEVQGISPSGVCVYSSSAEAMGRIIVRNEECFFDLVYARNPSDCTDGV